MSMLCSSVPRSLMTTPNIHALQHLRPATTAARRVRRPRPSPIPPPRVQPQPVATSPGDPSTPIAPLHSSLLNIYQAPVPLTVWTGIYRLCTLTWLLGCSFIWIPALVLDPATPLYNLPLALFATVLPFSSAVAPGQIVTSVNLHLPPSARRFKHKADLLHWTSHTPASTTRLRIQFLRFVPWLITREFYLEDMRKLPLNSRWRITNLEIVPGGKEERQVVAGSGLLGKGFEKYFWRYWVPEGRGEKLSRMPGVWGRIWDRVEGAAGARGEKNK
ncbi:hypothetical protein B0A50_07346 [Salinomyces thailandicus]|uniref:Uncharacterized protein n=1 Tax=Salinomyces thailandicus TaxID=706561 RepID=A0A4V5N3E4_9PEZI|nr:hypothetical protein B0A50_07346 [Salinomyces thailandica]